MACCYIAASMIAFIIKSCEVLDIDLQLQYNESVKHPLLEDEIPSYSPDQQNGDLDFTSKSFNNAHTLQKPEEQQQPEYTILSIQGMTCASCTSAIERALSKLDGVEQVLVSLPLQEARVIHSHSTTQIQPQILVETVEALGYDAQLGERAPAQKINALRHSEELAKLRESLQGLGFWSTVVFVVGKGVDYLGLGESLDALGLSGVREAVLFLVTAFAAIVHGGWVLRYAVSAGRYGRMNMHSLITASSLVGLGLAGMDVVVRGRVGGGTSEYLDAVLGTLLVVSVGRYMDLLSRRRASDTFAGLYGLMDETGLARLVGVDKPIPSHLLRPSDTLLIPPYTLVPVDAYILTGTSSFNESIITGESLPKPKTPGSTLLAGSRNSGPNAVTAMVTQDTRNSFLSTLLESVEKSLSAKLGVQKGIDVITHWFVSGIFLTAILAAGWDYLSLRTGDGESSDIALATAGRKLMTVLAAACPCALGLATPCAVMAGIDVAWRNGVVVLGGGDTMDSAKSVDHVVMDKTGTLTQGTPEVHEMVIAEGWEGEEKIRELAVLICAAEEEAVSVHPLAMAIFRRLLGVCGEGWRGYKRDGKCRVRDQKGEYMRGIACEVTVDGEEWRQVCLGDWGFLKNDGTKGMDTPHDKVASGTVVYAAVDGILAATMVIQDTVRPDAKATIDTIKALGIEVTMLTGDGPAEAARISSELDIEVLASCATPAQKHRHIEELQQRGHHVMMVGDGINDGPSLAASEVGVMLCHGRKCFSSGGSVLVLNARLEALVTLLNVSKKTMRQVNFNIGWALLYNLIAVALAVGFGKPWGITISPNVAAMIMSMSSVCITLTGQLLRMRLMASNPVAH